MTANFGYMMSRKRIVGTIEQMQASTSLAGVGVVNRPLLQSPTSCLSVCLPYWKVQCSL